MARRGVKKVPKILEQRALIDDIDRSLLKTASELSPRNNGRLLITSSILDNYVPSLDKIASTVNLPLKEVEGRFDKISKIWEIPVGSLPTNLGFYSEEESLVNALVNQHRLRWDEEFGDYRVKKMHWLSGEMGVGTLFTNNDAFLGEKIVRQAMGFDDFLVSYHMQGGNMPDIVTLFGKAKNKRAIMTGLNKADPDIDDSELETIVQEMDLLKKELDLPSLSKRSIENVKKYLGTIDSMEEAAESSGYELAPLAKNLAPFAELHLEFSYNDDYNQSEVEDKNIAILRDIHKRMKEAEKKLPEFQKKESFLKEDLVISEIDYTLTNIYYEFLVDKRQNSKRGEFKDSGKEFRSYVSEFFETKKGKRRHELDARLRQKLKKKAEDFLDRGFGTFDSHFEDVWNRFYNLDTSMKQVSKHRESVNKKYNKLERDLKIVKNKISESKSFARSHLVEEMEGHAWLTKKIAIKPTEAKALETIKKEVYKSLYEEILIPSIKKHSGREDLQIFLHTDDIISMEIPDPQHSIEGKKNDPNRPIGTIITSLPRTNAQSSNEPLKSSFAEIQSFHAGEVSTAVSSKKQKPLKKKDFNKRNFAHTNIIFSSYGADGYLSQHKFTIDPTTVQGEYAHNPDITMYIKIPTRQDISKLGELMTRGNKGTWAGKRLAKGGTISGSDLVIEHADGTKQEIFFDDRYFKKVASIPIDEKGTTLGQKYNELELMVSETSDKKKLNKFQEERSKLLEKARPHIGNIFLQGDMHIGSYSTPGRPSNSEVISSTQLVALQTLGVDGFKMNLMGEALHGELGFRAYDSKREAATNDDITHLTDYLNFGMRIETLQNKMKSLGARDKEILEAVNLYTEEFHNGLPAFKPEDQLNMFDTLLVPANTEMMENGTILVAGTGNHWMGKKENQSEATVIAGRFDRKYQEQGLLTMGQGTSGQSINFDYIKFPGKNGKGIEAVFAHKMPSGKTEIDQIANFAVKAKSPALYYVVQDRHHSGAFAEKGKMGVLDSGKQSTIPYAKMIGKCASTNATMIMGYGMDDELVLSSRQFGNYVTEKIIGWNEKAGILSRARGLIVEATYDDSVARELKKMNFAIDRASKKASYLKEKLGYEWDFPSK